MIGQKEFIFGQLLGDFSGCGYGINFLRPDDVEIFDKNTDGLIGSLIMAGDVLIYLKNYRKVKDEYLKHRIMHAETIPEIRGVKVEYSDLLPEKIKK